MQLWKVFICVLWSVQFHVQGWVRSTRLSSLKDLAAVSLALPCSTCPSQWAKQDLWFHSTWGFLGHPGVDGWMGSLPVKPPLAQPCLAPFLMDCGQPQLSRVWLAEMGSGRLCTGGCWVAEHSSRYWLPISLYPRAESSGALGLAVLGMSVCYHVCVRQGENTSLVFALL